jgi:pyridinium-3,5-bisthiocarboxylic acid mononucleotide nickel chelatase
LRTLYFDCFSGAAGDMILGALVDLGVPVEAVRAELDALDLPGWDLRVEEVQRGGLRATSVEVVLDGADRRRPYREIVNVIESARLSPPVASRALRAFERIARAEARVHGLEIDDVHFHEVGSLDAIVDVVGCSAALEYLSPERVVTSTLATGAGTVRGSHGILPVPPPAVAELLAGTGATIEQRGNDEMLTPTGAAILAANSDAFGRLPAMALEATGYGAGTRDTASPNVLRAMLGDADDGTVEDVVVVECNIDDMNPELFPHVIDRLLGAGAQDAWVTPIVMKKGRPAFALSALAPRAMSERLATVLFEETSTLGLRITGADKVALEREWVEVEVVGARVRVKVGRRGSSVFTAAPEFEDAAEAARTTGLPLKEIYDRARSEARKKLAHRSSGS